MGILSFAALLSYDVNQDSLNNTQPVQDNWVGTVGANFANWVLGSRHWLLAFACIFRRFCLGILLWQEEVRMVERQSTGCFTVSTLCASWRFWTFRRDQGK